MGALIAIALAASVWMVVSLLWGGVVCVASRQRSTSSETWCRYWLGCVLVATAPPLLAPAFVATPVTAGPLQLDVAVALADWTAPLQRQGLPSGMGVEPVVLVVFCAFGAGFVFQALRLVVAMARVRLVIHGAKLVTGAVDCGNDDVQLLSSEESFPVFCVGGARASVILSRPVIEAMTTAQLRLIVRHELAHLHRRDPVLFLALELLDIVFWFNPFVRRLTAQTRLGAEIACDAMAIEATGASRSTYAKTYVRALETNSDRGSSALAAFGRRGDTSRIRLSHILNAGAPRRPGRLTGAVVIVALVLSISGAALAASTARMAVFGDPTLLSGLQARVARIYHGPRCGALHGADLRKDFRSERQSQ